MKRVVLVGALMLLSMAASLAQTSVGIKGGVNFANIGGDAKGTDMRLGLHAGFFASTSLAGNFGFQPEVLYSQQGFKYSDNNKAIYHYINVPLMFKFTMIEGLHLQAGPQVGYLLSARQRIGNTITVQTGSFNRFDAAVGLGLGYDFSDFQVSARYNLGLTDTRDSDQKGVSYPNNVIQLSLGIRL